MMELFGWGGRGRVDVVVVENNAMTTNSLAYYDRQRKRYPTEGCVPATRLEDSCTKVRSTGWNTAMMVLPVQHTHLPGL